MVKTLLGRKVNDIGIMEYVLKDKAAINDFIGGQIKSVPLTDAINLIMNVGQKFCADQINLIVKENEQDTYYMGNILFGNTNDKGEINFLPIDQINWLIDHSFYAFLNSNNKRVLVIEK